MKSLVGAWLPEGGVLGIRPAGAVADHGDARTPLWTVGYREDEVRAVADGPRSLLVAGACGAGRAQLRAVLTASDGSWWESTRSWPGSFVAVRRDQAGVSVRGDLCGLRTVYWARLGEAVVWADAAAPLAAAIGTGPDLVRALCAMTVTGVDPLGGHSLFEKVHRVPPGGVLRIDPDGVRVRPAPPLPPVVGHDHQQRLAAAITAAVRLRVAAAKSPTTDLSGGLDSGTLASVAAGFAPTLGITWRDRFSINSDVHYARDLARQVPGLDHEIVTGTEESANYHGLQDVAEVPFTDGPSLALATLGTFDLIYAAARAHDSDMHLSGEGGDAVLTGWGALLVDAWTPGRRREVLTLIAHWARLGDTSVAHTARRLLALARADHHRELARLAEALRRGPVAVDRPNLLARCGPRPGTAWLTRHGRHAVADIVDASRTWTPRGVPPGRRDYWDAIHHSGTTHADTARIAEHHDIALHLPYLDDTVIGVCAIAPELLRFSPRDYKPLLHGLRGTVPDLLLERRTAGAFDGTARVGLTAREPWVRDLIASSRLADAGLIDPARATATLDRTLCGMHSHAEIHHLIATETWARVVDHHRDHWWTPTGRKDPACA
ncbi:asparagine synthase-related protein [Embleya sp. NPDC059237]|uniref:asparagine synthase-related protein n=1 Tax=Embleya sp. NPDC059237 TaxID=3346784 RepID=UPI0036B450B0